VQTVVVATIDNLLKGAATQAMQNANLVLGLDEHTSIIDPVQPSEGLV
jgi:N-acetyl-gamma-glutamyl-phosphate reductase